MGIDRPDVEAVVQYAIPGSIEAYYQEIGRGGRDGRPTTATLLWDHADVTTREFLIDSPRREKPGRTELRNDEETARRKALDHRKLQRMIDYADTTACLRSTILRYFGDAAAQERCAGCSNCRPDAIDAHDRELLRKILAGIARAGERYGRQRITAVLLGQDDELPRALTTLSTFGLLRDQTADALREWISAAVAADLIVVSNNQYRTLSLTTRGREFMHGRADDVSVRRPPRTSPWSPSRRARDDYRDLLDEFRLGRTRRFRSRR